MNFLRNIGADLVEKRLWPVAVALLVALIAVPTLLAKSSSDDADVAPAAPVAGAAAVKADQVARAQHDARRASQARRQGQEPVRAALRARRPTPVEAVSTEATGARRPTPARRPPPVAPTPAKTAPAPAKKKSTPKANLDVYRATLRFGEPGAMRTIKDIARLTPLPSVDNPFFVFLGVKDDGETLVFLVSSDAKATGDGVCRPQATCETDRAEGRRHRVLRPRDRHGPQAVPDGRRLGQQEEGHARPPSRARRARGTRRPARSCSRRPARAPATAPASGATAGTPSAACCG